MFNTYKKFIPFNGKKKKKEKQEETAGKMCKRFKQTFFQRRHTSRPQMYEYMLNITIDQGNGNQNHNEISPHTCYGWIYIIKTTTKAQRKIATMKTINKQKTENTKYCPECMLLVGL